MPPHDSRSWLSVSSILTTLCDSLTASLTDNEHEAINVVDGNQQIDAYGCVIFRKHSSATLITSMQIIENVKS